MLEWKSGRDSTGRVPRAGDKPAYAVSSCGRYTIARVMVKLREDSDEYDWRSEVNHIADGVVTNLGVRLDLEIAKKKAEDHADGLVKTCE